MEENGNTHLKIRVSDLKKKMLKIKKKSPEKLIAVWKLGPFIVRMQFVV